jgi:hypothetical protein
VPDLRSILRTFTPAQAVRNSRRETHEQQRIHAEIDALTQRLARPGLPAERRIS